MNHEPLISVVVPTRDRPEALERCLDALDRQSRADQVEVVVVDDGSVAMDRVSRAVDRHSRARLVRSPGAGPAAARNAGARAARGVFLCFTDDDCVPEGGWVAGLVDVLEEGAVAAAGVTIAGPGVLAEASELVAHALVGSRSSESDDLPFAPSNNLAVTKAVFETIPFDESYTHAAGEDREWCSRLIASGHSLRPAPGARLVHRQDLTLRRFLRQQFRYGEGAFRYRRRGNTPRRFEPPAFYVALVRRGFARGVRVGALVCAAQAATALGYFRARAKRRD